MGKFFGYGEIYPVDFETIRLHYLSPCGGVNQPSCDVDLKYTVTEETLIIADNEGDLVTCAFLSISSPFPQPHNKPLMVCPWGRNQ
jgi:hypothetical protein